MKKLFVISAVVWLAMSAASYCMHDSIDGQIDFIFAWLCTIEANRK